MPFRASRITVKNSNKSYQNLQYGKDEDQTVTFSVNKIYSHFGVKKSKFGGLSIGLSIKDTPILKKLLAVETRCAEIMGEPNYPSDQRLMKRLYEKDGYSTLNLNLDPEEAKIKKERPCLFSGLITVSAIYLGDASKKHTPNLRIEVSEVSLELVEPTVKEKPKRVAIVESDDEDSGLE